MKKILAIGLAVLGLLGGGVLNEAIAANNGVVNEKKTTSAAKMDRPSEKFRREHAEIREHLRHISEMAGALPQQATSKQQDTMKKIVGFLNGHIKPHVEWEERVLYLAVDKRAGDLTPPFTSTMRNDHKIVGRWINELVAESSKKTADAKEFSRKTDRLLGLITAHFENEEEVLLAILDKSMTKEEFEREIMSKAEH